MAIVESVQVDVIEPTPADGRWFFLKGDPTSGIEASITGRTVELDTIALRKVKATVVHLLEAEEVTVASIQAAIAAEFAE